MTSRKESSQEMYSTEQMDEKTFFSKLRHLAVQIDNESSIIQEELNSRKLKQYEQHVNAIMFLHETKKELSTIVQNARSKRKDFSTQTNSFGKMQELITNILNAQKMRYDQVESFMVPYGFSRPEQNALPSDVDSDHVTEASDKLENKDSDDQLDDDEESGDCAAAQHTDLNTGTPQHGHARPVERSLMSTPQLEDLYGQLSEPTILLMQHGFDNAGQVKFGGSMEARDYSRLTCIVEPERHVPLIGDYRSQATEKSMALESGNVSSPQLASRTERDATLVTGAETPVLHTPGFNTGHFKFMDVDREVPKCAKSSLYTPPVPDLLTCVLSTPECPVEPRGNKENEPMSRPSGLISTPEEPKLLSSRMHYGALFGGSEGY